MNPGDLIMFVWPDDMAKISEHPDWDSPKIGLLLEVLAHRPGDEKYGDEWLVLHKCERWSVPSTWCRPFKEKDDPSRTASEPQGQPPPPEDSALLV